MFLKLLCWWMVDVLSAEWHVDVIPTALTDGMFEDIHYIIILCNDMNEVRWDIWLPIYCKFHGECDSERMLKIGQCLAELCVGQEGPENECVFEAKIKWLRSVAFLANPVRYMNTRHSTKKQHLYQSTLQLQQFCLIRLQYEVESFGFLIKCAWDCSKRRGWVKCRAGQGCGPRSCRYGNIAKAVCSAHACVFLLVKTFAEFSVGL